MYEYFIGIIVTCRESLSCVQTELRKNRIRWAGHVRRMPNHRIPKQLLYCKLSEGERSKGRPVKRFKDCLKDSLKDFGIDHDSWEERAADRPTWRSLIRTGAKSFETNRALEAKRKRAVRKGWEQIPQHLTALPHAPCASELPRLRLASSAEPTQITKTQTIQ